MLDTVEKKKSESVQIQKGRSARSWVGVTALLVFSTFAAISMLGGGVPREGIGLLTILLVLLLMLLGVHIGLSMVVAGSGGLLALGGSSAFTTTIQAAVYDPVATWTLSVIPTFILMGTALARSGLTQRAFAAAKLWLGNVPAGLALTTTAAGAGLAASSGSSIALTHALGRVAIPEMLRANYRPGFAIGATAMAGAVGQIIPPSVLLVVYAGAAQTSVGQQLMAGLLPGLLLIVLLGVFIFCVGVFSPKTAPRVAQDVPLSKKIYGLAGVIPLALVIVVVVGGIGSGIFTPTEAAAIGALIAFTLGWIVRNDVPKTKAFFWEYTKHVVGSSLAASAGIFLLLIGVELLTRVVTLSRVANGLTDQILALGLSTIGFLLVLVVFYIILGMFMDTMAIILLTVPVLIGPLSELGVDLVWFGVFLVIMVEIGMVTPPMGILCFVLHRIVQDKEVNYGHKISLVSIFAGCIPFILVVLAFVVLIIFVPDIVTWLPNEMITR